MSDEIARLIAELAESHQEVARLQEALGGIDDAAMSALDVAVGYYGRSEFDSPERKLMIIAEILDRGLDTARAAQRTR